MTPGAWWVDVSGVEASIRAALAVSDDNPTTKE